jgi:hypothetical protein
MENDMSKVWSNVWTAVYVKDDVEDLRTVTLNYPSDPAIPGCDEVDVDQARIDMENQFNLDGERTILALYPTGSKADAVHNYLLERGPKASSEVSSLENIALIVACAFFTLTGVVWFFAGLMATASLHPALTLIPITAGGLAVYVIQKLLRARLNDSADQKYERMEY